MTPIREFPEPFALLLLPLEASALGHRRGFRRFVRTSRKLSLRPVIFSVINLSTLNKPFIAVGH